MRKEIFLCGFLAVAGISADVNLDVAETETREAVSNVLAGMYAQAKDIQYSFLEKKLVLTGIEYDIPEGASSRRGSIERMEFAGFDRAVLQAPAAPEGYSPEKLPRVAESIAVQGWSETMASNGETMTWTMASFNVRDWYQRLGTLLAEHARSGKSMAFFEEMLRCRMDEAVMKDMSIKVEIPNEDPVSMHVDEMAYPGGIKAPDAAGNPQPVSAVLTGVSFETGETKGTVRSLEFSDILPLSPAQLAEVSALVQADGGEKAVMDFFRKVWAERPPFSRLAVNDTHIFDNGAEAASMDLVSYDVKYQEKGWSSAFDIKALRFNAAALGDESGVLARRAPKGLAFDSRVLVKAADAESAMDVSVVVDGLGTFKLSSTYPVNIFEKIAAAAASGDMDYARLSKECMPLSTEISYKDSGLVALIADWAMDGAMEDLAAEKLQFVLKYLAGKEYSTSLDIAGLKVPAMAVELSGWKDIVAKYAPQGVTLDAGLGLVLTNEKGDMNAALAARGLGNMDLELTSRADYMALVNQAVEKGDLPEEALGQISITGAKTSYRDSGLLPLAACIAAKEMGAQPADVISMAKGQAEAWAGGQDAFLAKAGALLKEQLDHPGEMAVKLAVQAPMALMDLIGAAMSDPSSLPVEFVSKPGEKSMEDWLK